MQSSGSAKTSKKTSPPSETPGPERDRSSHSNSPSASPSPITACPSPSPSPAAESPPAPAPACAPGTVRAPASCCWLPWPPCSCLELRGTGLVVGQRLWGHPKAALHAPQAAQVHPHTALPSLPLAPLPSLYLRLAPFLSPVQGALRPIPLPLPTCTVAPVAAVAVAQSAATVAGRPLSVVLPARS